MPEPDDADIGVAPDADAAPSTARDALLQAIGVHLTNAGILVPAAEFVAAVRRVAGTRASPREVLTALEQMATTGREPTVNDVAAVIVETRGDRSRRQQRHAGEWRALGALLSLRGLDGSPEGQRAFIGEVRHAAGKRPSDRTLLRVAIAAAELGGSLDTTIIGKVARRISSIADTLDADQLRDSVQHEIRMLRRESTRGTGRIRSSQPATSPSRRTWRPGGRRNRIARRSARRPNTGNG